MAEMLGLAAVFAGQAAGSIMMPLAIVAVLVAAGFALILFKGSKIGWILVAAGLVYGWFSIQPIITGASSRTGQPSRGYTR